MKTQLRLLLLMGALALSALPAAGCGGTECGPGTKEKDGTCVSTSAIDPDGDITCGEGTKLVDGKCVAETRDCAPGTVLNSETGLCDPVSEDNCGPKTVMNPDGRCVIAADACEAGETLDPNSGDCIAGGPECGSNTALDAESNTCVPTEEVCDGGTVFNEETGLCLPGETCKEGDVLLNGLCVSSAEELASRADLNEKENNDPSLGGEAEQLTLKAPGSSTVFTGTIREPVDLDGDDLVDQDIDVFSFDATGGQWFQLAVQSTGLPSPAFIIEGPEGYVRTSPLIGNADPAREFVAPLTGSYTITVLPAAAIYAAGPFGQDDWGYVGSLEEIAGPDEPTGISLLNNEVVAGDYSTLTDNFFKLTGFHPGDIISLSADVSGENAFGRVQVWSSSTEYESELEISQGETLDLLVPPAGDVLLLVDAASINGPSTNFEFSGAPATDVEALGLLADGTSIDSTPVDIDRATVYRYTFTVNAGQVIDIFFDHASGRYDTVDMTLKNSGGQTVFYGDSVKPGDEHTYWYTEQGGTFLLEFTPHYSFDDLSDVVATIASITPNDLGAAALGDNLYEMRNTPVTADGTEFHLLSLTEPLTISGQIASDDDADIDVVFYNASNEVIRSFATSSGTETISPTLLNTGVTLIQVLAAEDTLGYEIDLTLGEAPQLEVEPNESLGEATPVDITKPIQGTSTDTSDVDVYSFSPAADMAADEVLIVTLEQIDSGSGNYACTLLDTNGDPVGSNDPYAISGGCVSMAAGLLASETYYLEVLRGSGSTARNYAISSRVETGVLEIEPNDSDLDATPFTLGPDTQLFGHVPLNTDTDYFSFEVTSDMPADKFIDLHAETLSFNTTSLGDWMVVDNAGVELASDDLSDDLRIPALQAGTYFVVISRTSSSESYSLAYQISVSERTAVCGNDIVEPGEECEGGDRCSATCQLIPPTEQLGQQTPYNFDRDSTPSEIILTATQCATVAEVTLDVDFSGTWKDELDLDLVSPDGTTVRLNDESIGATTRSFTGTYPDTLTPHGPGTLADFIGQNGNGDWKLVFDYHYSGSPSLDSFSLNLYCN